MNGPGTPAAPGTPSTGTDLLARVLNGELENFALLHRAEAPGGPHTVEVLTGDLSFPGTLAEVPLPPADGEGRERQDVLAVVPYRQIAERGFAHVDDGAPLLAMRVDEQSSVSVGELLARVPDHGIALSGGDFDIDDDTYAETVRRVIENEIGRGEGANFVVKRSFTARIDGYTPRSALTFFRRLLEQECGAYWTFVVRTPERTFVGASPERHVSLHDGTAVMNPISGTYRYPATGPELDDVLTFLADRKEADELYMVVDEELKMMARVCDSVPRVTGPRLKEMARLAHTEYFIEGRSTCDPRLILRETMFAPTVTGSPLENACRVIARHEPQGRGHYSGVLALIGRDAAGARTLDSSILIRTAEISGTGQLRISAGATLVRHSVPESEVEETRVKTAGLLHALQKGAPEGLAGHQAVRSALAERNTRVAGFWLGRAAEVHEQPLRGTRILVVDAEDTFTAMLAHQLRSLGPSVTVRRFDEEPDLTEHDLVVMGPGPGDPLDAENPKIASLRASLRFLLETQQPFLAVCLSHQVLSGELGLKVARRPHPNQGVQRTVDLFGRLERVGFYNTFAAQADGDKAETTAGPVEVSRDEETGEVHALRGRGFASLQFHPESLLTQDGVSVLARMLQGVIRT